MGFEEYEIVKLYDKIELKNVYVAILKVNEDKLKVKLLKQPSYNMINKKYSDDIFKQYCHPDDEVLDVPLNFDRDYFTFEISEKMCQPLDKVELIVLLKHLTYIDFTKDDLGKVVVSNALDKFI